MTNSAIVEIRDENGVSLGDLDIPLDMPVKEVSRKMLEFFRKEGNAFFSRTEGLLLYDGDNLLGEEETLASEAIWDGSIITIRRV